MCGTISIDIVPLLLYNIDMGYLTTAAMAEKWGISDRRVRVLCKEERIPGVIENGNSYLIPCDAEKPADKRYKSTLSYEHAKENLKRLAYSYGDEMRQYLSEAIDGIIDYGKTVLYMKWENDIVGKIDSNYNLVFTEPRYNSVVSTYSKGHRWWSREEFEEFIHDRVASKDRRDIERIMFRCGLSSYDTIKLGIATKAMCARDMLWITDKPGETMCDAMTEVFESVFNKNVDAEGDSVDTPDGCNIKRYGVFNGKYGIYKKRLNPISTDVESELAVYELAQLMGVRCCPVYRVDKDTVFSQFEYNFADEFIVHFRRLLTDGAARGENEYNNLLSVRPQYQAEYIRMIALDFVTRQDDRHLSNIAIKMTEPYTSTSESFYPLYDNGRSLFYEDSEETAARACRDIEQYATSFGPVGTYYDCIKEIAARGTSFAKLVNLDISQADIAGILERAGFTDYRLRYGIDWVMQALEILKHI